MLSFLFEDKRELFPMKLSFEEFNLVFFTADQSAFEPTEAAGFLKKLEVHSVRYGQGKVLFKREFLYF